MHIITGGAGFLGSNIAAALDDGGHDVVIVDTLGSGSLKWRNIAKRRVHDLLRPDELAAFLDRNPRVESIVHMGGISRTTETDVDLIVKSNFRLSVDLWTWCAHNRVPFIYASSAATYGDGRHGFNDRFDDNSLASLRPLNPYAWSKHVFDRWVCAEARACRIEPPNWAGLKFFNVYGPNEYHKQEQRSVAVQLFEQITATGRAQLFKSENVAYPDGGQTRDFVWVGDCVEIVLWLLSGPTTAPSSIYNVGSGAARTFLDKATIIADLVGRPLDVQFTKMPEQLSSKYQYFTLAHLEKLRDAGYEQQTTSLEQGLDLYVKRYLQSDDPFR